MAPSNHSSAHSAPPAPIGTPDPVPVLVVGAGPVGLFLACELRRNGVPSVRIIDAKRGPSPYSKALAIHSRGMEVLDDAGVSDAILSSAKHLKSLRFYQDGALIGTVPMLGCASPLAHPAIHCTSRVLADHQHNHHDQQQQQQLLLQKQGQKQKQQQQEQDQKEHSQWQTRFPAVFGVPQWHTEEVLNRHLAQTWGVEVEWETELVELDQVKGDTDICPLMATIRRLGTSTSQEEKLPCTFVCACDGARSLVRTSLGVAFDGFRYPGRMAMADVAMTVPLTEDSLSLFMDAKKHPGGMAAVIPFGTEGQRRLVFNSAFAEGALGPMFFQDLDSAAAGYPTMEAHSTIDHGPDTLSSAPSQKVPANKTLTKEEVEALGQAALPLPFTLEKVGWTSVFSIHLRGVRHLTHWAQRVFFVGDAAHIHSPLGGQGMNMGLQDAHNLAWKLALALTLGQRGERELAGDGGQKGHGGLAGEGVSSPRSSPNRPLPLVAAQALLESFHSERYPIIQSVLHRTDSAMSVVQMPGILPRLMRYLLLGAASGVPSLQVAVAANVGGLANVYSGSPIVGEFLGSFAPGLHLWRSLGVPVGPEGKPGSRAPDVLLQEVPISQEEFSSEGAMTTVHSVLKGIGHHVLLFPGSSSSFYSFQAQWNSFLGATASLSPSPIPVKAVWVLPKTLPRKAEVLQLLRERGTGAHVQALCIDAEGEVAKAYRTDVFQMVVVRPDKYIAYRSVDTSAFARYAALLGIECM